MLAIRSLASVRSVVSQGRECDRDTGGVCKGLASAINAPLSSVERHGLYGLAVFGEGLIYSRVV